MSKINRNPINNRVTFTSIKEDKFKANGIYVNVYLPLDKETAPLNTVLANVISSSCKEYPNMQSLNRKLSMLYGANISGTTRKIGDNLSIILSTQGIDDKYAIDEGEKISKSRAELLCSMIFNPNVEGSAFCKSDVEREKRQVLDYIDAMYNDKRQYSLKRCTEIMFANEQFGINRLGTKEQVEKITPEDLYVAWQNMINNGIFEIVTIGSSDYDDVKVVILGQDPYHGDHEAHGLSFSVRKGVKRPPSLDNIFKELKNDLGIERTSNDLTDLAKQGVFLLNSIMTVVRNTPLSHKGKGWETFTENLIKLLNEREKPVVFIFWGSYARSKKELITNKRHYVIESVHPSPLSANRGFFGSKPFSKANNFLVMNGIKPINWGDKDE